MPLLRGRAPNRNAQSASPKASPASAVQTTSRSSGNAQSSSSMAVPASAGRAGGMSSSCSATGCCSPYRWPAAMRKIAW